VKNRNVVKDLTNCMKNRNIVKDLTNLVGSNPMMLMFVLDSIDKNVKRVLRNEQATIEAMKGSFINGEGWVDTAKHIENTLWPKQ